jgi:hypothetical protein
LAKRAQEQTMKYIALRTQIKNWATRTQEEFEDTNGVIRIRISKKNRQHNGQKKKLQKDKQRSTKHTHKAKDLLCWCYWSYRCYNILYYYIVINILCLKHFYINIVYSIKFYIQLLQIFIFELVHYTYSVQIQGYIARFFSIEIKYGSLHLRIMQNKEKVIYLMSSIHSIFCFIAILRYFPLILLSENFPSHASRLRWKIIASK